ncbi:MAG: hypothetical protein ACRELF_30375, partial [Gemmataceae bacterium]
AMKGKIALVSLVAASLATVPAQAGHEWPIYSSFYPSVIHVETIDPATAARLLPKGGIDAYVGDTSPAFTGVPPSQVASVESLGAFVVVSVNPPDCAALQEALRNVAAHPPANMVFHPYPVTPFHADYLEQEDRAQAVAARVRATPPAAATDKLRMIDADSLVEKAMSRFDGWSGPPWVKSGWFQAWQLLATALPPADQKEVAAQLAELERGEFDDLDDQFNAERDFVSLLTSNCGRAVAGYTIRHEWYDNDYSTGIQNIAFDSMAGFNAPEFIRTAKLKDYPWNGILRLGVPSPPKAAWNPVAGFTDPAGRLIWSALSDRSGFPSPYGDHWQLDR